MNNTEWKKVKLGDICTIKTGKLNANAAVENGEYAFFTCSRETFRTNQYSFDGEALLIAGNGDVGFTKYYVGKFDAYQRTYVLMNFSVDAKYIYFYLQRYLPARIEAEMIGSAVPYIKLGTLSDMEIQVPESIEEQRRIASLLSRFDELIQLHEFKADNLIKAKQQIMSDIFSGGLRDLSHINPDDYVQDDWRMMRLGDCTIVTMGQSPKGNEITETGKQLFMQGSAEFGNKFPKPFKYCDVSKRICNVGDVLMSVRAPVGAVNMADGRYGFGRGLCSLSPSILCSEYIYYVVKGLSNKIAELGHGSTVQAITIQEVKDFKVPVPPTVEEQRKIANLLSSYDSLIELKQSQKQQVTNMKQQLMNQLLSNGGGRLIG